MSDHNHHWKIIDKKHGKGEGFAFARCGCGEEAQATVNGDKIIIVFSTAADHGGESEVISLRIKKYLDPIWRKHRQEITEHVRKTLEEKHNAE